MPNLPARREIPGGGDMARSTGAFTLSSSIGFFPGGRVASRGRPSTPSARKRSRQRRAVGFDMPVRRIVPSDRVPTRAQALCAPARRASGGFAGMTRDPFEALALPVRKPDFPSCRLSSCRSCPSASLPFCWLLATAAGGQCHASGKNGITMF